MTMNANAVRVNAIRQLNTTMASSPNLILKFTSKQCPACRRFQKKSKVEFDGKDIRQVEIDFHENKNIAKLYSVGVLPTAVFLYNMEPHSRMNGMREYETFVEDVNDIVVHGCEKVTWE